MPAGIQEYDKGYVFGTTWHRMPQYIQLDRFVTMDEAEKVFDYPMEKVPLFRCNNEGDMVPVDCFGIVRTDYDILLHSGVKDRYTIETNRTMLRWIDTFLLGAYPQLKIESVGTLHNGQTAFLNLRAEEFQVKGDKSPTETNLAYSNPIGLSYMTYAHNTRIVCNNTLRISRVQGEMNKSMRKFAHTKNARKNLTEYMVDLSKVFLGLNEHKAVLNSLAEMPINSQDLVNFLDRFFSVKKSDGEEKKGRGLTIAKKNRESFMEVFERQKATMEEETAFSRYGMLQAFTDYIDHECRVTENTDDAAIIWDGMTGIRADKKDKVLQYLTT